jgi:hypothetical protein
MIGRRYWLAWGSVAAVTAGAAVGQTPSVGPSAAIPDFSGVWAHPYLPGFELPFAGAGPVRNKSRRNGVSNFNQLVGDDANPILQPAAAAIVKQHGAVSLAGGLYPTPSNQCWPGGVPYIFWDFLMEMFQQPDKTVASGEFNAVP